MRIISYAQDLEDVILYSVLSKYVKKGNYVDIGANDPTKISVTKLFYDRGWQGINFEPLDDMYELLNAERIFDKNYDIGLSNEKGELELALKGTGSSFCDNTPGRRTVKSVDTFANVWKEICRNYSDIHFCKIDVEGFEKNVLQGMDFQTFRPWIFVVESTLPGTNISCHLEWENILIDNGYVFAYEEGINRYYVDSARINLMGDFEKVPQFIEENVILQVNYVDVNYNLNHKVLKKAEKIVVFGTGYYYSNYMKYMGKVFRPAWAVDNNSEKWGKKTEDGIEIHSPNCLEELIEENCLIVICCAESHVICEQLNKMGRHNWYIHKFVNS